MRSDIELLRIVSAFGIVWFHSGVSFGHEISYGGIIAFVILSAYFAMISNKTDLLPKVFRLLIPCLVWAIIYAGFKYVRGVDVFPQDLNFISKILTTPSIHLWYLPFIFFVVLFINMLKKYLPVNIIGISSVFIAIIIILIAPIWRELNFISPFGQWAHAFSAVFIGIFFGAADKINSKLFYSSLLLVFASIVYVTILKVEDFGVTYLAGFIPCLILLSRSSLIKKNRIILTLSSTTLGIYLLHILVLFVLQYLGVVGFLFPIMAFVLSLIIVYISKMILPKSISIYFL